MNNLLIGVLALSIGFSACNDDEGTPPEIDILSPANSEGFNSGDSVSIHIMVSHINELHQIELTLINETLGLDVWDTTIHVDATGYMYNKKWYAEVTEHTEMKLRVLAEDHNENTAVDSVQFHIMP